MQAGGGRLHRVHPAGDPGLHKAILLPGLQAEPLKEGQKLGIGE